MRGCFRCPGWPGALRGRLLGVAARRSGLSGLAWWFRRQAGAVAGVACRWAQKNRVFSTRLWYCVRLQLCEAHMEYSPSDVIADSELSDNGKAAIASAFPHVRQFEELRGYAYYQFYSGRPRLNIHRSTQDALTRAMLRRGINFMPEDESAELMDFCYKLRNHMSGKLTAPNALMRAVEAKLRALRGQGVVLVGHVTFDDRQPDCFILLVGGVERCRWNVTFTIEETPSPE